MIQWIDGDETALLSTEPYGHIEGGGKPFAVRYQGEVFTITPWPATDTEGVVCDGVPIS